MSNSGSITEQKDEINKSKNEVKFDLNIKNDFEEICNQNKVNEK